MNGYEIRFTRSAEKEFDDFSTKLKQRLAVAIDRLAAEPRHRGVRKLEGADDMYRIRVGDYRVIYMIDDEARLVHVTGVRHRREAYD